MPRFTSILLVLVLLFCAAVARADLLPGPPRPRPRPRPRPATETVEVARGPESGGLMSVGVVSALVLLALLGDHRRTRRDDPTLEE